MEKNIKLQYFLLPLFSISTLVKKKKKEIYSEHKMQDEFFYGDNTENDYDPDFAFGVFGNRRYYSHTDYYYGIRGGDEHRTYRRWKCKCKYTTQPVPNCTFTELGLTPICPNAVDKLNKFIIKSQIVESQEKIKELAKIRGMKNSLKRAYSEMMVAVRGEQ